MIDNLVVSSGGITILSLAGALHLLEEKGILKNIKAYYGVSAGAILSAMLCLGYTTEEIKDFFVGFDINKVIDDIDISNLLEHGGLSCGNKMEIIAKSIVAFKLDSSKENYTFMQLFLETGLTLHVFAFDVCHHKLMQINHITYPNMPIWEALVASSRIPYLFAPFKVTTQEGAPPVLALDGAIIDPYPINYVPKHELKNTLGIFSNTPFTGSIKSITDSAPNIQLFLDVLLCAISKYFDIYEPFKNITINITNPYTDVKIWSDIAKEVKNDMFHHGYTIAKNTLPELHLSTHKSTQTGHHRSASF